VAEEKYCQNELQLEGCHLVVREAVQSTTECTSRVLLPPSSRFNIIKMEPAGYSKTSVNKWFFKCGRETDRHSVAIQIHDDKESIVSRKILL